MNNDDYLVNSSLHNLVHQVSEMLKNATTDILEQEIAKRRHISNCRILAQKLKEKAPDLEGWLNANFGEYLQ